MTLDAAVNLIREEYQRASSLYPAFHSNHEGYAVVREELDELWEAVKKSKSTQATGQVQKEAIQLAAMSLRFLVDLA